VVGFTVTGLGSVVDDAGTGGDVGQRRALVGVTGLASAPAGLRVRRQSRALTSTVPA
jgi:hypothetical protein